MEKRGREMKLKKGPPLQGLHPVTILIGKEKQVEKTSTIFFKNNNQK